MTVVPIIILHFVPFTSAIRPLSGPSPRMYALEKTWKKKKKKEEVLFRHTLASRVLAEQMVGTLCLPAAIAGGEKLQIKVFVS